ncbi:DUF5476 domain-containing protein [Yersinia enterocolitica]|uniref:DUF5476 domain-containing protein n=1 Tax=Yersinia enterocolitica TaxID=630 RepID=UPI003D79636B
MCFSPKVSIPKSTISSTPLEPAPLADTVEGVKFGSDTSDDDKSGTESLTIKKDTSDENQELSNNTTSSSNINASTVGKSIKRKSVFGGKQ